MHPPFIHFFVVFVKGGVCLIGGDLYASSNFCFLRTCRSRPWLSTCPRAKLLKRGLHDAQPKQPRPPRLHRRTDRQLDGLLTKCYGHITLYFACHCPSVSRSHGWRGCSGGTAPQPPWLRVRSGPIGLRGKAAVHSSVDRIDQPINLEPESAMPGEESSELPRRVYDAASGLPIRRSQR